MRLIEAAYAGFCPEEGIHAIQIAAEILMNLKQGHIGDDTTFNVGVIEGGVLTNIVPEKTTFKGKIRSYDHQKAFMCMEKNRSRFYSFCYPIYKSLIALSSFFSAFCNVTRGQATLIL